MGSLSYDPRWRPWQSRDCKGAGPDHRSRHAVILRSASNRTPLGSFVRTRIGMPVPLLRSHGSDSGDSYIIFYPMKFQVSSAPGCRPPDPTGKKLLAVPGNLAVVRLSPRCFGSCCQRVKSFAALSATAVAGTDHFTTAHYSSFRLAPPPAAPDRTRKKLLEPWKPEAQARGWKSARCVRKRAFDRRGPRSRRESR